MKEIKETEIKKLEGGAVSPWTIIGVGVAVVFLLGMFDGFTRPLKCN